MRQISRSLLRLGAQSHGCKTSYACRVRLDDHQIPRPTDSLPCTPPCMSADYGLLGPNESGSGGRVAGLDQKRLQYALCPGLHRGGRRGVRRWSNRLSTHPLAILEGREGPSCRFLMPEPSYAGLGHSGYLSLLALIPAVAPAPGTRRWAQGAAAKAPCCFIYSHLGRLGGTSRPARRGPRSQSTHTDASLLPLWVRPAAQQRPFSAGTRPAE
ncbi:hypothetical protein GQ53DRAFT_162844 [Thozetella sp. PMI_491]|nr:hypothetical protein GQ53DRAFT_162844 [Thozetella sp. PMI_491]